MSGLIWHRSDALAAGYAEHRLTVEGQPIADQLMGKCICGWRTTASVYEFLARNDAIAAIEKSYAEHLNSPKPSQD